MPSEDTTIENARNLAKAGQLTAARQLLLPLSSERAKALLAKVNAAILAQQDAAPVAEKPKNAVNADEIAKGIKQAKDAEKQQKAKQQGISLIISLVLICACCGWISTLGNQPIGQNDSSRQQIEIMSTVRGLADVDVRNVEVVHREDGYSGIIIAYHSNASSTVEFYAEYGAIFGSVGSLIRKHGWQFDDLALVVGDRNGNALHTVGVQIADVLAFIDGSISVETFAERMTIVDF